MRGLFVKNAGVWSLRSLPLRRFFDLQYASIEYCLRRGIERLPKHPAKVLDFGAGFAPYHGLFPGDRFSLESLDAHVPAKFRAWSDIPADARYDLILAIEVLEHLSNPTEFFAGALPRLTDAGELWLSIPYSVRVHPCPDDWHRWTPQGFTRLINNAGFEVVEFSMRGPAPLPIFAKIAYGNFQLLKNPPFTVLGCLLLPLTIGLLAVAHLFCPKSRASDEDPLGFFVRARPK